ncbi:MAG TPA: type II toxin-antitoxin system VapC family toxin [Vicinamibacterales bacterium]|nr:type II toxin-antitoxin system VapC family toxin [Vicinamibacterales bacterium]
MTWTYCDTSALIKRYVAEPGRREVLHLLRRHACVTSALFRVELRSALRRRVSDGSLDEKAASKILQRFEADRAFWTFVEVTSDVLVGAEALVAAQPLRTLDAIHVATGRWFADQIAAPDLIFASADARQIAAARAVGLTIKLVA